MKYIAMLIFFFLQVSAWSQEPVDSRVRNVILMIGDGTGLAQVAITHLLHKAPSDRITFFKMPVTGLVLTQPQKGLITDSAAGATAMATGFKTHNKMIGQTPDGQSRKNLMEAAREKGMKTGIVVTSHITDATPACFYAHVPLRDQHPEIARQMINSRLDVMMGGGYEYFIPQSKEGSERQDDHDLFNEARSLGYDVVETSEELQQSNSQKLMGIFSSGGLKGTESEPDLATMTQKALSVLSDDENGFLLMVEGSQIDWECHSNNLDGAVQHVLAFEKALEVCLDFAKKDGQTLIIVTADHETGGLALVENKDNDSLLSGAWTTGGHSAIPVPLYAFGPQALLYTGVLDNTDIAKKIAGLLQLSMSFE